MCLTFEQVWGFSLQACCLHGCGVLQSLSLIAARPTSRKALAEAHLREGIGRSGQAGGEALVPRRREGRAAHERVAEAVVEGAQVRAADVELAGVAPALVARHLRIVQE